MEQQLEQQQQQQQQEQEQEQVTTTVLIRKEKSNVNKKYIRTKPRGVEQRDTKDIYFSILQATMDCMIECFVAVRRKHQQVNGARLSHIKTRVRTSSKYIHRYLEYLIRCGLITIKSINTKTRIPLGAYTTNFRSSPNILKVFVITDKGRLFLELYKKLNDMIKR